MKNDRLLEGVQAAHDMACRSVGQKYLLGQKRLIWVF